jgi:uncharacterized protein YkwD
MRIMLISLVFCLTVGGLVTARSRIGAPYTVTLDRREVVETWVSSREDEQSANSDKDIQRRGAHNQQEQRAYDLTNAARKSGRYCGSKWFSATSELAWNDQLADAARQHASDMRNQNYFSHTSLDGRSFSTRIVNAGYRNFCTAGENIAGNSNADNTVQSWLNSPGHCENLMSGDYRDIGIGYASGGPYGAYWVQNFARRC